MELLDPRAERQVQVVQEDGLRMQEDVEAGRNHVQQDAVWVAADVVDDVDARHALGDGGLAQIEMVGVRAAGIHEVHAVFRQRGDRHLVIAGAGSDADDLEVIETGVLSDRDETFDEQVVVS